MLVAEGAVASGRSTSSRNPPADRYDPAPDEIVSREARLMGGRVGIHLEPTGPSDDDVSTAASTADVVLRRIAAWADRLTRFSPDSELVRLNGDARPEVPVGPTLAAILDWGREAETLTGGIVDIGLLDARLAAEFGQARVVRPDATQVSGAGHSTASRSWSLRRGQRGALITRPVGLRFDLDGIGKGWLADRALDLLIDYPTAVVDGDGDIAITLRRGTTWRFGVADPRSPEKDLATIRLVHRGTTRPTAGRFGLATSGTTVHRWQHRDDVAHHLIDPRTGRSAVTDVVQATVLARNTREAEAFAKTVVILGSEDGLAFINRHDVDAAVVLTDRGEILLPAKSMGWVE